MTSTLTFSGTFEADGTVPMTEHATLQVDQVITCAGDCAGSTLFNNSTFPCSSTFTAVLDHQ